MRLGLFDRIRRLAPRRRSRAAGTTLQGRHRRDQRHAAGYGPPAEHAFPGSATAPPDVAHEERPASGSSFSPGAQPGRGASLTRGAQPGPGASLTPDAQPAPGASLTPGAQPGPGSSFSPGAQPGPARRAAGSPAVRVGGARARIREAPGEPATQAATGPPAGRYQAR